MTRTIDMALTQLGVCEATGNNDGVPAERYMRGDRLPWCAGFILWCNALSTEDERIAPKMMEEYALRNVEALEAEMRRRGWWFPLKAGDVIGPAIPPPPGQDSLRAIHLLDCAKFDQPKPQPNDLVFYGSRAGSDGGGSHHVGIIQSANVATLMLDAASESKVKTDTLLHTIEGNYGNRVALVTRDRADPATCITGYARIPPRSP